MISLRKTSALLVILLGSIWAAVPAAAQDNPPRIEHGTLTDGDDQLGDGSPFDLHTVQLHAGETLVVEMTSDELDTYLGLTADFIDDAIENDDREEDNTNSRIEFVAPQGGEYDIVASCFDPAARGAYTLTITVQAGGLPPQPAPHDLAGPAVEPVHVAFDGGQAHTLQGTLTGEEPRRGDGRPLHAYAIHADAGQSIAIDLRSQAFDPYLFLIDTDGNPLTENDDHNGSQQHSRIEFTAPRAGTYTLHASCYNAQKTGDYSLTFSGFISYEGALASTDETLSSGEYIDWYEIECDAGELVMLQVDGVGFDTYLIFEDPDGSWEENDDAPDTTTSRIESNIFRPGTYRVGVTSYEAGETGSYRLSISSAEGYRAAAAGAGTIRAEFDGSEATLTDNGYVDAYAFEAQAGNTVIITMRSEDVDAYLKIKGPDQLNELNDDYESDSTDSQMAFRVSETGTYYLSATTYGSGETGGYELVLDLDANKYSAGQWAVQEGGRVYGVFVGINDYPDDGDDLPYCDTDATRTARAFRRHFGMDRDHSAVLTNSEATAEAIREAIDEIGAIAGPDDMFVFFYSGHGDQVPLESGTDVADPDGSNETLNVYGGSIVDDEFAQILDGITAGTTMVVIDACFSGGFAKDVVTRPGRIGLFSSEGDCLSMVADKYEAGGYLSLFFTDALNNDKEIADLNGDRMLTAHELTFYLQTRFDEVVRSGSRSQPSRLYPNGAIDPGANLGYQRILSDRDGVSPHIILMDW